MMSQQDTSSGPRPDRPDDLTQTTHFDHSFAHLLSLLSPSRTATLPGICLCVRECV
jgi:hypothetical protein